MCESACSDSATPPSRGQTPLLQRGAITGKADRFGFNVKVENIMTNFNYLDFLFHILIQQGMSKMTNYTACLLR